MINTAKAPSCNCTTLKGMVPQECQDSASAIADAAYTGSIIDTSDLAAELTRCIHTSHPYRAEDKCKDSIERIRDTHGLHEAYGITGLSIRHSQGLKQTQRFLSTAIHQASFGTLFSSLKKTGHSPKSASSQLPRTGSKRLVPGRSRP